MAPSSVQQNLRRVKTQGAIFSKRPCVAMSAEAPSAASVSRPGSPEILMEITTPGARAPIHFVEESSAFRGRGKSRYRRGGAATSSSASFFNFPKPLFPGASSFLPNLVAQQQQQQEQEQQWQQQQQQRQQQWQQQQQMQREQQQRRQQEYQPNGRRDQPMGISGISPQNQKHRRTSSPMDGTCFTLLGVMTGLKTPGADHWTVARALVQSSVDLRTRNAKGMTPLHVACAGGQVRHTASWYRMPKMKSNL